MNEPKRPTFEFDGSQDDIATRLLQRASTDLVFRMSFIGQSHDLRYEHFRRVINQALEEDGLDPSTDPIIKLFVESHAAELREFVITGVSLERLFHIKDIEQVIGEQANVILTDIWDSLRDYIKTAEEQFKSQAHELPKMLQESEQIQAANKKENS